MVHVVWRPSVFVIVVMSGEVVCWFACGGFLVGVSVFSMIWSEFCIMSEISVPLWSSVYECQCVECAFMSPVIMVFCRLVR